MATVRNKFHELGNWHNKISLAAITTKGAIEKQDITKLSDGDLRELMTKTVNNLKKIEQFIIGADETIGAFKPYVYKTLDPDVEIKVSTD